MGRRVYFSGKNLEQALRDAARHHGIEPDQLAWKPMEKRTGVLTQRRGKVVIKVDPDQPRKIGSGPVPTVAEEPATRGEPGGVPPVAHGRFGGEIRPWVEDEVEEESVVDEADDEIEGEEDEDFEEELEDEDEDEDDDEGDDEEDDDEEDEDEDGDDEEDEDEEDEDEEDEDEGDDEEDEAPARVERRAPRSRGGRRGRKPSRRDEDDEPSEPVEIDDRTLDAASDWLERLLELADLELDFEVVAGDEGLEIDLQGPDEELVVEEEGEILRAIQHLLPRVLQSETGTLIHCRLDCAGFQAEQEERLRELARRTADEVRRKGRSKTLRPMHPADRRIIHLELADEPDVDTESVGSGYFKRVMVRIV